jgi:tetratricopeptide (TPR) repeat protein
VTAVAVLLALALSSAAQVPPGELETLGLAARWDDVISRAGERIDAGPNDFVARYWLGRAWLARGEGLLRGAPGVLARDLAHSSLGRAVAQLERAVDQTGVPSDGADWLAYARFLRRDVGLAAELEAWHADSGQGYPAYLRGLIAQRDGDAEAECWLQRAVAADPGEANFALTWAIELGALGRRDEALSAWSVAAATDVDVESLLPVLLQLLPDATKAELRLQKLEALVAARDLSADGFVAWYRGHSLQQLGRLEEAETVFAEATDNRSSDVDLAHLAVLLKLDRGEEALGRLERWALVGDPRVLSNLVGLGNVLGQARRWDAALEAYDMVLATEPAHERALRNRALTLSRAGRGEAGPAWEALVQRYGDRADVLNDAALMLQGAGENKAATVLWERAVVLDGAEDARENLAAERLVDEPEAALELLDRVLAKEPRRDRALYLRLRARLRSR